MSARPRTLTIRRKLTLVMVLTSCVTLLTACVAWLAFDWNSYREHLVEEVDLIRFEAEIEAMKLQSQLYQGQLKAINHH